MADYHEVVFESEICAHLEAHGWLHSANDTGYDRERALFPEDLFTWLEETQKQAYEKALRPWRGPPAHCLCPRPEPCPRPFRSKPPSEPWQSDPSASMPKVPGIGTEGPCRSGTRAYDNRHSTRPCPNSRHCAGSSGQSRPGR